MKAAAWFNSVCPVLLCGSHTGPAGESEDVRRPAESGQDRCVVLRQLCGTARTVHGVLRQKREGTKTSGRKMVSLRALCGALPALLYALLSHVLSGLAEQ